MIELTEIHDAFNDQQRICQAGGWITTCIHHDLISL